MGRHTSGHRKYEISGMWEQHHAIKRMLVAGVKQVDIAKALGVTPVMVSYTANSAIVQREIQALRNQADKQAIDVVNRIQEISPAAIDFLEGVITGQVEGASVGQKLLACNSILDRNTKTSKHTKLTGAVGLYTPEDIEKMKQDALANIQDMVVTDYEEVVPTQGELQPALGPQHIEGVPV